MGVERLDDTDYPALTIGQAADLIGVAPAFLRSLDAADLLHPYRSGGGQRRYSRRQVEFAARVRHQIDDLLGRDIFGDGVAQDLAHLLQVLRPNCVGEPGEAGGELAQRQEVLARLHDPRVGGGIGLSPISSSS